MHIVANGDDFGASEDTVRATVDCLEAGALTSASIMVAMPATQAALDFAGSRPDLSFGLHLTLVGDGRERPLSDPERIPALVDESGFLLPTGLVRRKAVSRRLPVDQIEGEIESQLTVLREAGVAVSHVDSHRHVHKLAPVRAALRRVLPRFGVRRVRRVQDVYLRRPLRSPTYWVGRAWQRDLERSFATTDHFYMPSSAGDVRWAETLLQRLAGLRGGTLEVGVHPGSGDEWRADEAASVTEFAERARAAGHELVPWSAIG